METNKYEEHEWKPFSTKNKEQQKNIDRKPVSTEDSFGLGEIILKKIKQLNLEKEKLDTMLDIPEELLKPVYKKEILLDREKRIGKEIRDFYENKEIDENERSEKLNILDKQLKEIEEGIEHMDRLINVLIAEDKDLCDKYVKYVKIYDQSKKVADPVDPSFN